MRSDLPELVLASASPRRRQLLAELDVPFSILPADIDESVLPDEQPETYVRRMAAAKARQGQSTAGASPVLGADTAVVLDAQIFGKPRERAHALDMLGQLSARSHAVISCVALAIGDQLLQRETITEVCFGKLSAADCDAYWSTGEPADKAGGYAIQGYGARFVKTINGSYTGVVGLPLFETAELLRLAGYRPGFPARDRGRTGQGR
jgi:septum formation protein